MREGVTGSIVLTRAGRGTLCGFAAGLFSFASEPLLADPSTLFADVLVLFEAVTRFVGALCSFPDSVLFLETASHPVDALTSTGVDWFLCKAEIPLARAL